MRYFLVGLTLVGLACSRDRDTSDAAQQLELGEATVSVGADDAQPGHALFQVRAAIRDSNGRLIIADGGSGEARIFDAGGVLIATRGRKGAGPGEHQRLSNMWLAPGDTLITYDAAGRKFIYWSPNGAVAREILMTNAERSPHARLRDGSFMNLSTGPTPKFAAGTSHTDTLVVSILDAERQSARELVRVPYQTRFGATIPGGNVIFTPLPLEPMAAYAAGSSTVFVGYGAAWKIRRFNYSGEELEPIELSESRTVLTTAGREAWAAPRIEAMPAAQQQAMREYLGTLPYSDSLPAYDTFVAATDERLWVRAFPVPGVDSTVWRIFDREGRAAGLLTLAETTRVLHAGDDYVVISDVSDDGTEIVSIRQLRAKATASPES